MDWGWYLLIAIVVLLALPLFVPIVLRLNASPGKLEWSVAVAHVTVLPDFGERSAGWRKRWGRVGYVISRPLVWLFRLIALLLRILTWPVRAPLAWRRKQRAARWDAERGLDDLVLTSTSVETAIRLPTLESPADSTGESELPPDDVDSSAATAERDTEQQVQRDSSAPDRVADDGPLVVDADSEAVLPESDTPAVPDDEADEVAEPSARDGRDAALPSPLGEPDDASSAGEASTGDSDREAAAGTPPPPPPSDDPPDDDEWGKEDPQPEPSKPQGRFAGVLAKLDMARDYYQRYGRTARRVLRAGLLFIGDLFRAPLWRVLDLRWSAGGDPAALGQMLGWHHAVTATIDPRLARHVRFNPNWDSEELALDGSARVQLEIWGYRFVPAFTRLLVRIPWWGLIRIAREQILSRRK